MQVMKAFESLMVISVNHYCKLTLPTLHVWKWLPVENILLEK